ncbi:hypothetical protein E2C01_049980 [Portunus trituberculatus]|uniref:Uncharacterized protein n=1 Tax=Portunus trituberculatus TaxID=210409 RepID=A0A5B7G7S3_PORTR|nr:hypothetical protein [Portunus trituberculatus]
MPLLPSHR